jgi:hypothetical protein
MLCLPYYAYVFSSTKLEIWAEQILPGNGEGEEGRGKMKGLGVGGCNDLNK